MLMLNPYPFLSSAKALSITLTYNVILLLSATFIEVAKVQIFMIKYKHNIRIFAWIKFRM